MSAREVLDWMWIGVDAFVAIWFAALAARGPSPRVHGPFAILAGAMALSHATSLGMLRADDIASASRAQDGFTASVLIGMGAFVDLATALANERRRMPTHAWWLATLGAGAAIAGLTHDPSFASGGPVALARLTPLGLALYAAAMIFVLLAIRRLHRASRSEPEIRVVLWAVFVPALLTLWDLYARVVGSDYGHVSGMVRGFVVVVLAHLLLGRFLSVERQLIAKSEELTASTERLRQAQAALDRTEHLAAVGELSAVIAHEIKNPLAVLHGAATTLRKASPEEAPRLLEILDEEADRLDRLVDDVLVYARPLTPETTEIELGEVVTHALRLALDGQPTARNIVIDWEAPEVQRWVRGDGTLIRHALINIVDNAILAMPAGGAVVVRLRETEVHGHPGVAIEFTDEGEGMDTLVRQRAKDPFFTTRETGTGLGLAIVDRVARVHGGAVSFASQAGAGTTVTFAIPLRARTSMMDIETRAGRESLPPPFPIESRPPAAQKDP